MSIGDGFLGAWRVTEYVFEPNGRFAGTIQQRRTLHQATNGHIRVVQQCRPSAELVDHPMAAFAGEWVFDLHIDGPKRHYHGPDVVGMGVQWADGIMTGRGRWPRFGHDFVSFGFLDSAAGQITGGAFHDGGIPVARIIGSAHPETPDNGWPILPKLSGANLMPHAKESLAEIVGNATYQVWTDMLAALGPDGRTHRIAPLVAGMLTYAALCGQDLSAEKSNLVEAFMQMDEAHDADSVPRALIDATMRLFYDAGVATERTNSRGNQYSVLDNALEEFIHWYDMPWEW